MHLYQKGDSANWWCEFRLQAGPKKGSKVRRSTGETDRRRAEIEAGRIRADLEKDASREPAPPARDRLTLIALAGHDLARAEAKGAGVKQLESIENCWRHLCRVLGTETDPATVSYDVLEDYLRTRRGEGAAGQSIRKDLQALRRGLQVARRKGALVDLPEFPEVASSPLRLNQRGKLHPLPVLLAWLEALEKDPRADGARDQAELALLTGLRATELRRLSASWMEAAQPGVGVAWLLRVPAWAAKNRHERVLGLTGPAAQIIMRRAKGCGANDSLLPSAHLRAFAAAAKVIGYHQPITLRDLRHTHATLAAQGTGDAAAAQAALGHSDLATTQRYLSTTIERTAGAAVAVLSALSAHRGPPTGSNIPENEQQKTPPEGEDFNRGEWIRTTGFLLPKQEKTLQRHLSECRYCQIVVAECMGLQIVTGDTAHRPAHRQKAAG